MFTTRRFFIGGFASAFALGPWDLMVARFIGGIGVGASSIAAPVYIAEISPAEPPRLAKSIWP
jgi:MFS family permease